MKKGEIVFLSNHREGTLQVLRSVRGLGAVSCQRAVPIDSCPALIIGVVAHHKRSLVLVVVKTSTYDSLVTTKVSMDLKIQRLVSARFEDGEILVEAVNDMGEVCEISLATEFEKILKSAPMSLAPKSVRRNCSKQMSSFRRPDQRSDDDSRFKLCLKTGRSECLSYSTIKDVANGPDGLAALLRERNGRQFVDVYQLKGDEYQFLHEVRPLRHNRFVSIRDIFFVEKTVMILEGENNSCKLSACLVLKGSPVESYFLRLNEFAVASGLFSSRARLESVPVSRSLQASQELVHFVLRQHIFAKKRLMSRTRTAYDGPEMTISTTTLRNLRQSLQGYQTLNQYLETNLPSIRNSFCSSLVNTLSNEHFFPPMRSLNPMPTVMEYVHRRRGVVLIGARLTFGCDFHLETGYQHYSPYNVANKAMGKRVLKVIRSAFLVEERKEKQARKERPILGQDQKEALKRVAVLVAGVRQHTIRSIQKDRFGTLPTLVRVSRVAAGTGGSCATTLCTLGNVSIAEEENEGTDEECGAPQEVGFLSFYPNDIVALITSVKQVGSEFWLAKVLYCDVDCSRLHIVYFDRCVTNIPEEEDNVYIELSDATTCDWKSVVAKTRLQAIEGRERHYALPEEERSFIDRAITEAMETQRLEEMQRELLRTANSKYSTSVVKSYSSTSTMPPPTGVRRSTRKSKPVRKVG